MTCKPWILLWCLVLVVDIAANAESMYNEPGNQVVNLTHENFDELVTRSRNTWFIEYYAPWCGHCVKMKPDYSKAAKDLQGIVRFGAVNCDYYQNKPLCGKEGISGFPTIKIYPVDSSGARAKSIKYQGGRDSKSLADAAATHVPKFAMHLLDAHNYASFLDQKHPKMILISERTMPTLFSYGLAAEFYPKVKVAFASSGLAAIVEKFAIDQFPTVVAIKTDGTVEKVTGKENINVHHLREMLDALSKLHLPVMELVSQEMLDSECVAVKNQICSIAFITRQDEFPESVKEFEQHHAVLVGLNEMFGDMKFFWVNPLKHTGLLKSLHVPDIFPGLVVVKPTRNIYRTLNTAYDVQSISTFLQSVLAGKIKMNEYSGPLLLNEKGRASDEL